MSALVLFLYLGEKYLTEMKTIMVVIIMQIWVVVKQETKRNEKKRNETVKGRLFTNCTLSNCSLTSSLLRNGQPRPSNPLSQTLTGTCSEPHPARAAACKSNSYIVSRGPDSHTRTRTVPGYRVPVPRIADPE